MISVEMILELSRHDRADDDWAIVCDRAGTTSLKHIPGLRDLASAVVDDGQFYVVMTAERLWADVTDDPRHWVLNYGRWDPATSGMAQAGAEVAAEHLNRVDILGDAQYSFGLYDTDRRRQNLVQALLHLGQLAADMKAGRAGYLAQIGALLRYDREVGDLVGTMEAERLTGLSRPALTTVRADPSTWDEIVDAARRVLSSGDADDHRRLHRYLPHLGGWYAAMEHLNRTHADAWLDERGGFDPTHLGPDDPAPGYAVLAEVYNAAVQRVADGDPHLARDARTDVASASASIP
jgi:hypothetical protein